MNGPTPNGDEQKLAAWAPYDYTDGKKKGEWKTSYPPEARKCIRWETIYLVVISIGCLFGVFFIVSKSCGIGTVYPASDAVVQSSDQSSLMFLGFVGALLAGTLGGCIFGLKCMYHFVAKLMWHEDRRLWRLLSPPLSGVLSLFMVFLVASGLLQIFDGNFVEHPIRVMAFSFLMGYYSDKALAKMADVADTLFGSAKKEK
jgi:hypothetical protein